jgi:hypothetical protein
MKILLKSILAIDLLVMFIMDIFTIIAYFVNIFFTLSFMNFYLSFFVYTLIKCFIGIVLFIIDIIRKNEITIKVNLPFMIPSILASTFLIYNCIKILIGNYVEGGMTIPTLLLSLGGILWIAHWVLFRNNVVQKTTEKILLSIIMPVNLIVLYIIVWGLIGI